MALAAGLLASVWFLVHLFVGGREVARPLRENRTLPEMARAVAWLCWHWVSGSLLAMAALLLAGAVLDRPDLVIAGGLLAAAFAVVGIALPPVMGWSYRMAPQGWLFVPVVALAALSL
jgi:hypothetical protein